MINKESGFTPEPKEQKEVREKGRNCTVKIVFRRHAHKESFDPHKEGEISQSLLSQKGREESRRVGRQTKPLGETIKAYTSYLERTGETADELIAGMEEAGNVVKVMTTRRNKALQPAHYSKEYIQKYRSLFDPRPENFESLPPAEQEKVIEEAEIPATNTWLDDWDKKQDEKTESAFEVAQRLAQWLDKKIRVVDELNNGSELEILAAMHRTTTEPLLRVLLGKNPEVLGLLEGWRMTISTDEQGQKKVVVDVPGERAIEVDWDEIKKELRI